MNKKEANIWIGEKDLTNDPEFIQISQQEFANPSLVDQLAEENSLESVGGSRRDFLKFLGFGLGATTIAASCEIPIKRAIPYTIKPDEIVPGVANYYASSYVKGGDYCPILVKTREGRPIKIEGNSLSKFSHGGTTARAQAMVLELYDQSRLKNPVTALNDGSTNDASWADLDAAIMEKLNADSKVRIVSNTILSPTEKQAIADFKATYPNTELVTYDPVSASAMLDANEESFGERVVPSYHFDKADMIVSFDADFLGTWIAPVEHAHAYAKNRKIKDTKNAKMSRHVQVESHMSMTGSNADNRILVKPSEQGYAIAALYNEVVGAGLNVSGLNAKALAALKKAGQQLKAAGANSLVVAGSNNKAEQVLVNAINASLGNIGTTVDFAAASMQRQGDDKAMEAMIAELSNGNVDAVIFRECNPVYDYRNGAALKAALSNIGLTVAMSHLLDETASSCMYVAPVHHNLESWSDVEIKKGHYGFVQPTISPVCDTRQSGHSLLVWANSSKLDNNAEQPYLEYLRANWQENMFPQQSEFLSFDGFWNNALHDGIISMPSEGSQPSFSGDVSAAASALTAPSKSDLEISFFETVNLGNGQFANNPWLQELPDPVSRTTWGNYLAIPVSFDGVKKIKGLDDLNDGDLVEVNIGDKSVTVPVVKQFGQMAGTVALALGYGREGGVCASGVGADVNPFLGDNDGYTQYHSTNVSITPIGKKEDHFSCVQYHHTMGVQAKEKDSDNIINADEAALAEGYGNAVAGFQGSLTERSVIFQTNIKDLDESVKTMQDRRHEFEHLNEQTLYPYEEYTENLYSQGHHWGMHIDLNSCIGCGACAVACMAENNVPVVGKKEVARHHEMTWLRIDRYFYGDFESPNTVYQPMMCQHCDNAPCENVCPVNATNHSSEGLNQMTYNRCVGTRYCANNCPYKVRRFNWLDYTTADIFPANQRSINGEEPSYYADNLTRMVLNPDVTVRVRGVIEKCSFCVQRIQEGKLTAKKEQRRLEDADVQSACMTACPTGAITFGDMNNKKGTLGKALKSPLNYVALEEVNTRSSVTYTMKVNNRDESMDA